MTEPPPADAPPTDAPLTDEPMAGHQPETDPPAPPRRRRRWRRVLITIGVVLVVIAGVAAGGLYLLSERIANNVQRIPDVFGPLDPNERPAKAAGPDGHAETFLIAGSDSRSAEPTTGEDATAPEFVPGAQRSDVIMLVRFNADRTRMVAVSLPRDSWVPIPGHGLAKINAAFSYGGPSLMVRTVETLTQVRVDHFAAIDFAGFEAMVDAVGGIDVTVAEPTSFGDIRFRAGVNHLDGRAALAYVRQRYGLPRGDLDRVQRQQNVLRALLIKAASGGILADPPQLYRLLDALSHSVSVDDTLTNDGLRSFAFGLRNLSAQGALFMTAPVAGTGREGQQSVVYLDDRRAPLLWHAFRDGDVDAYLRDNGGDVLGSSPR